MLSSGRDVVSEVSYVACSVFGCPRPFGNRAPAGVRGQQRQGGGAAGGGAVIEEVRDDQEGDLPRARSNHQPLVEEPDDAGTQPGSGFPTLDLLRANAPLHVFSRTLTSWLDPLCVVASPYVCTGLTRLLLPPDSHFGRACTVEQQLSACE